MELLTDQISLKKYFMLILSVTFLVPSQYSFPRLQLQVTKKYEIIFAPLCFYLRLLKKSLERVPQIFEILFHKLEIVILTSTVESGTHFCTQIQSRMCSKQQDPHPQTHRNLIF